MGTDWRASISIVLATRVCWWSWCCCFELCELCQVDRGVPVAVGGVPAVVAVDRTLG